MTLRGIDAWKQQDLNDKNDYFKVLVFFVAVYINGPQTTKKL